MRYIWCQVTVMTLAVWLQIELWKITSILRTTLNILQCCLVPGGYFLCSMLSWHGPGMAHLWLFPATSGAAVARSCYKRKRTERDSWTLSTTRPPVARMLEYCVYIYIINYITHTHIYIYIYAWYMIHYSMMLYFHVFSHTFYSNLHLPTLCSYAHLLPQSHDSLSHSPQTRGETAQLLAIAKLRSSDCSKRGLHCRINRSSTLNAMWLCWGMDSDGLQEIPPQPGSQFPGGNKAAEFIAGTSIS